MKQISCNILIVSMILFTACNNDGSKSEHQGLDMSKSKNDTAQLAAAKDDKETKSVAVTYTNVNANIAASVKQIVDHYLHIKNALVNDNGSEAANGAKAMVDAISKLDKSLLTNEQKAAYDRDEEELKENTEHIAKNGDRIAHQRSHFATLSEVVYNLATNFGAGRTLYHDFCPMARDKQGAMWVSELKEVKNPYFGSQMLTCGKVKEVIK